MNFWDRELSLQLLSGVIAGTFGAMNAASYVSEKIYPSCIHLGSARVAPYNQEYANLPTTRKIINLMIILSTVMAVGGFCGGMASGVVNEFVNRLLAQPIAMTHAIKLGAVVGTIGGILTGGNSDPILRCAMGIFFKHARDTEDRL